MLWIAHVDALDAVECYIQFGEARGGTSGHGEVGHPTLDTGRARSTTSGYWEPRHPTLHHWWTGFTMLRGDDDGHSTLGTRRAVYVMMSLGELCYSMLNLEEDQTIIGCHKELK